MMKTLSELINHDKFRALTFSSSVAEIASPLRQLGITYFNHLRIFNDLSRVSFGTDADWLMHFHSKKLYLFGCYSSNPSRFDKNRLVLWKFHNDNKVVVESSTHFNIDNGLTLVKISNTHRDFYSFASTRNNTAINEFLLSNRELLEKFISYYHENADSFIQQCQPDTPIFESSTTTIINEMGIENYQDINHLLDEFNSIIKPKKMRLHHLGKLHDLSPIEYNCLKLFAEGVSAKEIASHLHIQTSTFYRHIENLKIRLQLNSSAQLIAIGKYNYF